MNTVSITDKATAWLIQYLGQNGPTRRQELRQVAPCSARTLERAAARAGVVSYANPEYPRSTTWALRTQIK